MSLPSVLQCELSIQKISHSTFVLLKQVRLPASARYIARLPCTLTRQRDKNPRLTAVSGKKVLFLTTVHKGKKPAVMAELVPQPPSSTPWQPHPTANHPSATTPIPRSRHSQQRTKLRSQLLRSARRSSRGPRRRQGPLPAQGDGEYPQSSQQARARFPPPERRDHLQPLPAASPPHARTHRLTTPVLILICLKRGSAMTGLMEEQHRLGPSSAGTKYTAQRRDCTAQSRACAKPPAWTALLGAELYIPPSFTRWRRPHNDQQGPGASGCERAPRARSSLRGAATTPRAAKYNSPFLNKHTRKKV